MLKQAIAKIEAEMNSNSKNSYIQAVGGLLLQYLESDPDAAEKILQANKTIGKSFDEMRKVAEKKRDGNCAMLTDQEGFAVVLDYFGINSTGVVVQPVETKPQMVPKKAAADFDISLDDLLK